MTVLEKCETSHRIKSSIYSSQFFFRSSVCKKNLVLDSGVPVVLPLYPGECNVPKDNPYEEDKTSVQAAFNSSNLPDASNFIPTLVVKAGNEKEEGYQPDKYSSMFRDAIDFLHIPWNRERENNFIDNEPTETGRALNTRVINIEGKNDTEDVVREIVEPILKPQSTKNARSHNPDKQKPEITEPILRATTTRTRTTKSDPIFKNDFIAKLANDRKEIQYNFYDIEDEISWNPPQNMILDEKTDKKKRQESRVGNFGSTFGNLPADNPIEAIVTTVQFLPRRLARMFEQAEKYARETILPLVSTYTPKFISEIIAPKAKPKYVPLSFDAEAQKSSASTRVSVTNGQNETANSKNEKFDPPPNIQPADSRNDDAKITTPYTHIQKIHKKGQNEFVFPDIAFKPEEKVGESSRKARHEFSMTKKTPKETHTEIPDDSMKKSSESSSEETQKAKGIYIDLPVFEAPQKSKYIPLSFESSKNNEK